MKGKVYLVGAGPGDYKLMTLKGLECIRKSDVIVYDRLANINYLKEAKENCEFVNVGKASSNHLLPQDDINRLIADKALEGKVVTVEELITLAVLPSREELIAKLAGCLLANVSKLAATLDAVRVQKESETV